MQTEVEQRGSTRRILKVKALLSINNMLPLVARTLDIGGEGMCVSMPHPLVKGQVGTVSFTLMQEGKPHAINARLAVTYCFFSAGVFRVGFKFLNLPLAGMSAISRFLRQP